jgi:SAM-dependent methyltransferase
MNPGPKEHWESVYRQKGLSDVSWYRPHLDRSLAYLDAARLPPDAAILDVGGGASTFVDDLLDRGYTNVSVLDLSQTALEVARKRLGARGDRVRWIRADVTDASLSEAAIDFWHDRAVFHFLADPAARARYVENARRSVRPGGHILVATFGLHGPEKCSGLDVVRYSPDGLHAEFGNDFAKVGEASETHVTPWGSEQEFIYCYCRLRVGK